MGNRSALLGSLVVGVVGRLLNQQENSATSTSTSSKLAGDWDVKAEVQLTVALGLLNPLSGHHWVAPEINSAAKLAVEYINNHDSLLPNVHLQLMMRDSACDPDMGLRAASDLMQAGVHAIIGAGCSVVCE